MSEVASVKEDPQKERLKRLAWAATRRVIEAMPAELREATRRVPIVLDDTPGEDDLLGVFEGPTLAEMQGGDLPETPQITLYLDNLWEISDGDENLFVNEVRITVLHEFGHFLDLDEEDLADRGLD